MSAKYLKRIAHLWAYPALRRLPPAEWNAALKKARQTNFDRTEWIGILAGITFATYLLRPDAEQAAALSLPVRYFIQFIAAVPLLILVVGPFYVRRTRRGLDQENANRPARNVDER